MEIGETLYVTTGREWRAWLQVHHKTEREIWLVYYRKASGKPRIDYDVAVEEALCFGWIDSTIKPIDDKSYAQRFSVRKKTSELSQLNKERVFKLIAEHRMTEHGLAALAHVFNPEKDKPDDFVFPPAVIAAVQENAEAWRNFQNFPDSYQRIRVAYIETRKHHGEEQYEKALAHFIKMTAKNKMFGTIV